MIKIKPKLLTTNGSFPQIQCT